MANPSDFDPANTFDPEDPNHPDNQATYTINPESAADPRHSADQANVGYNDPSSAAREWMIRNGINPNAANPVIQSMLSSAHGAARQFDLSTDLQGTPMDFMGFLGDYMNNRSTPGAGPMFSKDQIDQMIARAMQSAATHTPDGLEGNPWQQMFGNYTSAQAQTAGYDDVARPDVQARAFKALLAGAYQDTTNPWAQQATQGNIDQQLAGWQADMLTPGKTAEQQVPSFLAWLMSNGGVPGQGQ